MVLIAANQDTVFRRLAQAMGQPGLATDPRYATHAARGDHQPELDALINDWTRTVDLEPLQALLEEHGVPCGLIYTAPDMLKDPHFKAREAIVDVAHPVFGSLKMQNVAPRLSATPGAVRHAGPDLGEHNTEVLGGLLGIDPATQDAWRAKGII